jgi:hypothetical protein
MIIIDAQGALLSAMTAAVAALSSVSRHQRPWSVQLGHLRQRMEQHEPDDVGDGSQRGCVAGGPQAVADRARSEVDRLVVRSLMLLTNRLTASTGQAMAGVSLSDEPHRGSRGQTGR